MLKRLPDNSYETIAAQAACDRREQDAAGRRTARSAPGAVSCDPGVGVATDPHNEDNGGSQHEHRAGNSGDHVAAVVSDPEAVSARASQFVKANAVCTTDPAAPVPF